MGTFPRRTLRLNMNCRGCQMPLLVRVLGLSQLEFKLPLYLLKLLVMATEDPLLLIQQSFDVAGNPGLVIRKAMYSPSGHDYIHAEVNVISGALCDFINVLSPTLLQYSPVSGFKAVSQSLLRCRRLLPEGAGCDRLPHNKGFILRL